MAAALALWAHRPLFPICTVEMGGARPGEGGTAFTSTRAWVVLLRDQPSRTDLGGCVDRPRLPSGIRWQVADGTMYR